ncbi:coiled-coil domain-containing protein 24 isoform X1 [Acipenser oxyrinchus oxyrinchus]|uniref:Coiled-coil domain-containing protein 24 isoform X1 n=1 Tax=Acipenser oxyrinchus oxyrinchus TaxID=40147 RepID=A0AAD8G6J1_ACIOX|nr:coiled-coil domain-containing protein 24 isoform X1 [Acipenser oxyrinchus oxyrinchus]
MACVPDDGDSGFLNTYEPPQSLWKLVEEYVPLAELPEIKSILGETLVDLSLEMHKEVETWLGIRRDMQSKSFSQSQARISCPVLADPPAIKEMLKQEIRLLLLNIHEKAGKEGRDENKVLMNYNPCVVSFVMGSSKPASRLGRAGSTRSSCDSRPQTTNSKREERPFSSLSTSSSIEDDIDAIKEKLNVVQIDEVVTHLKFILQEECNTLEKDVQFLQECVEGEHQYRSEVTETRREPSMSELKEERKVIEQDLQLRVCTQIPPLSCKAPVCRSVQTGSRTLQPIEGPPAEVLNRIFSAPVSSLNYPAHTPQKHGSPSVAINRTTCQPSPSSGAGHLHQAMESMQAFKSSCGRGEASLRARAWKADIPCPSANGLSQTVSPGGHVKCLTSDNRKGFDPALYCSLIQSGIETDQPTDTQQRRHSFHSVLTLDTNAKHITQALPSRFTLTLDAEPASKTLLKAFVPTPPTAGRPAGRPHSASRRVRLLHADSLTGST